jgi:hypothetical protein
MVICFRADILTQELRDKKQETFLLHSVSQLVNSFFGYLTTLYELPGLLSDE